MPASPAAWPDHWTLENLLEHLGGIPPNRVRLAPAPGTATVEDVSRIEEKENRHYELIDGILVEKCMGLEESLLAGALVQIVRVFATEHDLGLVTPPDGAVEIAPGQVRIPDTGFFPWSQFRGRKLPRKKVPALVPALAIEVLSAGNTAGELQRKLKDYFFAGVKLVWYIDPRKQTIQVFTAPDESRTLSERDTLDGGDILPGFRLVVRDLFAEVPEYEDEEPPPPQKKKRR